MNVRGYLNHPATVRRLTDKPPYQSNANIHSVRHNNTLADQFMVGWLKDRNLSSFPFPLRLHCFPCLPALTRWRRQASSLLLAVVAHRHPEFPLEEAFQMGFRVVSALDTDLGYG